MDQVQESYDEFLSILSNILNQLLYFEDRNMPIKKVLLNTKYMYIELSNLHVQLIYMPIEKEFTDCNVCEFVQNFISKIRFADMQCVNCVDQILHYLDSRLMFSLREFYTFIIELQKEDILKVDLPNISSAELNIRNITLWTQEGSSEAVRRLKNAIRRLSDERGRMDAYENRLDHTFLVLNNYNENLTKAESQIRDTDMAQEITEYTKNSIILQSAQNMLIKANLMPETILQLLQ